jgi:hypothetical protein
MPHSPTALGVEKVSTTVTGRPEIASKVPFSTLTVPTLARLAIGLVIAALIVIGLTRPSGAQTTKYVRTESSSSWPLQQDTEATLFARCLQDWDAITHMTKQEWSGACKRVLLQRRHYLREQPKSFKPEGQSHEDRRRRGLL